MSIITVPKNCMLWNRYTKMWALSSHRFVFLLLLIALTRKYEQWHGVNKYLKKKTMQNIIPWNANSLCNDSIDDLSGRHARLVLRWMLWGQTPHGTTLSVIHILLFWIWLSCVSVSCMFVESPASQGLTKQFLLGNIIIFLCFFYQITFQKYISPALSSYVSSQTRQNTPTVNIYIIVRMTNSCYWSLKLSI